MSERRALPDTSGPARWGQNTSTPATMSSAEAVALAVVPAVALGAGTLLSEDNIEDQITEDTPSAVAEKMRSDAERASNLALAGGTVVGVGVMGGGYALVSHNTELHDFGSTMKYALRWQAVIVLPLAVSAVRLALSAPRRRKAKGKKAEPTVEDEAHREVVSSTAIAAPAALVLAASVRPDQMQLMPTFASLVLAGSMVAGPRAVRGSPARSFQKGLLLSSSVGVVAMGMFSLMGSFF